MEKIISKPTKRQIYFYNPHTERCYVSPEFNGDRDELILFNSKDKCSMSWDEVRELFNEASNLLQFMKCVRLVDSSYTYYMSEDNKIGTRIYVTDLNGIETKDETYYIVDGECGLQIDSARSFHI